MELIYKFIVFCTLLSIVSCGPVSDDNQVKLSVYYESLCPDSIRFLTTQLYPNWKYFGQDILNVELHPFGKANFTFDVNHWDFSCQHGPDECQGNKVQACILDQVKDPAEQIPLIYCIMASSDPPTAAAKCITSLGIKSTTPEKIASCAGSDHGSELLHDIGVDTGNLEPPLDYVPWIIFNDVFSEKALVAAQNNLTWVICCRFLHGGDKCNGYPDHCV